TTRMITKMAKPPTAASRVTRKPDLEGAGASLMVCKAFADAGVADGDQLGGGEAAQVGPDADTADADHGAEHPQEVEGEEGLGIAGRVLEGGQDVVAHVEEDRGEDPDRDGLDAGVHDLVAVGEQVEERHEEVAEQEHVEAHV